ncbi:type II toxin-antitoxin system VapC family toxin [Sphingomonas sp. KR1UV-12]|uniref:Ribonuclease VapC n=1 Tax=Sphingomonas aurea TaxID=3063994 RepID=A0ABT9EM29_9SPHN|nr:type II toxin-antitoxin system VapC family toxin [Sphingomonas sp. KR1UV-12]MDP1027996.1 type II toxin-antitoxin system VapC family toxin [Sphingomonas sp. KR1UV-12]
MILLDTNVVSELRQRRGGPDPQVMAWLTEQDEEATFLSAMTVLELERGMLLLERRDADQGQRLRLWWEAAILPRFSARILPVGAEIARVAARLHVPDPRPEIDALISATALVHGLMLATRNVRDFAGTGVRLVDPWAYGTASQ